MYGQKRNSDARTGRADTFFARLRICMAIVIGSLLLNRVNAPLGQAAAEKLGLSRDYTVSEIREVFSAAYDQAETAMSERMADVFDEPYTSSGAREETEAPAAAAAGAADTD